ncbi:DegT/DnrJ/EryC1/StrS family aminotransferase [Patescibacteria group bacterium]|nr:DegT/DnrJ/EryC1/StrS family aminotransferase [Patescibacteria group bacterium]
MTTLALFGGQPVLEKPFPTYYTIGEDEKKAVNRLFDEKTHLSDFVARGGEYFLGGKYVKELEKHFTDYFKVKHAVSFNSATTALQAAVAAVGAGPGDEVITSPYTMSATAASILYNNALPVFADIDPDIFNITAETIEPLISPKTKAILPVNIFGLSADYDPILELAKKHDLPVIEDNAQSPAGTYKGRYAGTIGDIGVFSLNTHKVIQCGEGGILVTNNDHYAHRARLVRNHGEVVMDDFITQGQPFEALLGNNFRLSEIHAAVAIEQFKKLDELTDERTALAQYLAEQLQKFPWLTPPKVLPDCRHVYYIFSFKINSQKAGITRKQFAAAMKAEGFPLAEGYQKPLYLLPVYQQKRAFPNSQFPFVSSEYPSNVSYKKGICPVAERMFEEELLFTAACQRPQTKKDLDLFIQAIKKIEDNFEKLKTY